MSEPEALLIRYLRSPAQLASASGADLQLAMRQAEPARLQPLLAKLMTDAGCLEKLPEGSRQRLVSSLVLADSNGRSARWEIERLGHALGPLGIPLVLLKGAAYLARELPHSRTRLLGDIDLLVPRAHLRKAEKTLNFHGWLPSVQTRYDQFYYRRWMHELPPMLHGKRKSVLDLHHSILPPTSRYRVASEAILADAVALPGYPGFSSLSDRDLILHSIAHLFTDGEWDHALRDLNDINQMLQHFDNAGFYDSLQQRARELGLLPVLYYALSACGELLGNPRAGEVAASLDPEHSGFIRRLTNRISKLGMTPAHGSCMSGQARRAKFALYVRGHWLRMPLPLLLVHLAIKAGSQDKSVPDV